mgnify:CR=1 FL=1
MTWRDYYYHRTDWPEAASWEEGLARKEEPPIDPDAERPGVQKDEELIEVEGRQEIPVFGPDEK